MMRKLISFHFVLLMVILLSVSVSAATSNGEAGTASGYQSIAPIVDDTSGRVYDFADLLSDEEEQELDGLAKEYEKEKGYRIVLLTTDDNSGTSMAYADDFFDFNGFGPDGVLFLIDMDNREQWISTTGICTTDAAKSSARYTDPNIESILDETTPYAKDGDYFGCMKSFLEQVHKKGNILYLIIPTVTSLIVSAFLMILALIAMLAKHKAAAPINNAKIAVTTNQFNVISNNAAFLGTSTTSRHIPHDTGSGGGGSFGGGTHMGGSGTSHGGGGRGF